MIYENMTQFVLKKKADTEMWQYYTYERHGTPWRLLFQDYINCVTI